MVSLDNLSRALTFSSALMILGMGGNYSYRNYTLFDKYEKQAIVEADILSKIQDRYIQKAKGSIKFDGPPETSPLFAIVMEMVEREKETAFYNRAKKNPLLIPYYTWLVNHGFENPIESKLYNAFMERHENKGIRRIELFE